MSDTGNHPQLSAGDRKISSQLQFNSFLTGANLYTNMRIASSMKDLNNLNQGILHQNTEQTRLLKEGIKIQKQELQKKQLLENVKELIFQINKELKSLENSEDNLHIFLSLESLYALMVKCNITSKIVPDIQEKEYIEKIYEEIEKRKKEAQGKFNKQDKDDFELLKDILEEEEEEKIEKIKSQNAYKGWEKYDKFISQIQKVSNKKIIENASKLKCFDNKYFKDKGFIEGKKNRGNYEDSTTLLWSKLLRGILAICVLFCLWRLIEPIMYFGFEFFDYPFAIATGVFSLLFIIHNKNHNKKYQLIRKTNESIDAFNNRDFDREEREKLKEIIIKKHKDKINKFAPLKKEIEELEKRIKWEKGKAKDLVSRRLGLNKFLESRSVVD